MTTKFSLVENCCSPPYVRCEVKSAVRLDMKFTASQSVALTFLTIFGRPSVALSADPTELTVSDDGTPSTNALFLTPEVSEATVTASDDLGITVLPESSNQNQSDGPIDENATVVSLTRNRK